MTDGRKNNGGHSTKGKAGRKPKADEDKIRELTSPHVPGAIEAVVNILKTAEKDSDRVAAAKLLLSYAWGTPKQSVDHTNAGEKFENEPVKIIFGKTDNE